MQGRKRAPVREESDNEAERYKMYMQRNKEMEIEACSEKDELISTFCF